MYGINARLQRSFDRAQAQYEAQTPPGWEDDDREDCEDGDCGDCPQCALAEAEYRAELAAEQKYDARHDR